LIHAVETKECRITKFADDKGTDLLEEKDADQAELRACEPIVPQRIRGLMGFDP